ncbi:hypothetical protein M1328_00705 [Patescibacteria group bacterium]|nr:hypothetical protein [Patescibacteria group bacterium]
MPTQNVLDNLKQYFITQAVNIDNNYVSSNPTGHPTDTGENREDLLVAFLNNHLPAKYEALKGGKIFDSNGNISEQVDVLIYDKNTPQLKERVRTLYMSEGVGAAIEVKPNLDNSALKEALNKVDSFKKPIKSIVAGMSIGDVKKNVYSGIFSYQTAMDPATIKNAVLEKYKDVEINLCIDFICINKKFIILKNNGDWEHKNIDGIVTKIEEKFIIGDFKELSLYKLLMLISKEIGPNYLGGPDYSKYINI